MKTQNQNKFNTLSQRQKKFCKTKIALLNAVLDELENKNLASIMIKDLALRAEVSEPTFFNYFDSKQHMLVYFIQMWSVEMQAIAKESQVKTPSAIHAIKSIFITTAEQTVLHPRIMLEIIAFQTQKIALKPHSLSDGEKWLFFEDIENVENLGGLGLEDILPPLITRAVLNGELKKDTDEELLLLLLSSLFFGTSLLILKNNANSLPALIEAELNIIFEKVST